MNLRLGFWKNKDYYVTHKNGLTQLDLESLRELQVGDKLVFITNPFKSEDPRYPDCKLLKFRPNLLESKVAPSSVAPVVEPLEGIPETVAVEQPPLSKRRGRPKKR